MDFGLDPFDDISPDRAINNVGAGRRFQPKVKPKPKPKPSNVVISAPVAPETDNDKTSCKSQFQDAQHFEAATSDGNGNTNPSFVKSTEEAESFGIDFGQLDNVVVSEPSTTNSGKKFHPIVKPQTQKEISASFSSSLATCTNKEPATVALTDSQKTQSVQSLDAGLSKPSYEETKEDARTKNNGDGHSFFGGSALEVDGMGFDLDPFFDTIPDPAISNARRKFQPRVKAHPRKGTATSAASAVTVPVLEKVGIAVSTVPDNIQSAESIDVGDGVQVCSIGSSLTTLDRFGTKEPSQPNDKSFSEVQMLDDDKTSGLVNSQQSVSRDNLQSHISVGDPSSRMGKPMGEHADIFLGLECIHELVTQSGVGTDIPAPASNDREAVGKSNLAPQHAADSSAFMFQESEAFPNLQSSDLFSDSIVASDSQTRKLQPRPKIQNINERPSSGILPPDVVKSVVPPPEAQFVPSETVYLDEGSVPPFPSDDVLDYSSMDFGDFTTSEFPRNEEQTNIAQTTCDDANDVPRTERSSRSSLAVEINEGKKSSTQLKKQAAAPQLVDEPEDGASGFPAHTYSSCLVNEEDNNYECREDEGDDDVGAGSTSQKKRVSKRLNKPVDEKEKPVRKRKGANDAPDQSTQKRPKKFSHSTRRKKRLQELIAMPEDEIDFQRLPCRDIILFAGYKEQIAVKEAKASKTSHNNQSTENQAERSDNEHDGFDDGRNSRTQSTIPFYNSHSFMDKTPRIRWSKQDTEKFYEGVRQFGTDLSMIQQLFPNRTRHQIKLKLKKEERQQPLMLYEALNNRPKDHSCFEMVIKQLQQDAAQADLELDRDDSVAGETGKEESEIYSENNEEVGKPEHEENVVVEDQEANTAEVHSPLKSDQDDDDMDFWSSYRSEF